MRPGQLLGRVGAADGHGAHAGAARGLDAKGRIFKDDAALGRHADAARGYFED